jgi:8-oxo-dGTP pyrophosphatase MutT (NUDIX family)
MIDPGIPLPPERFSCRIYGVLRRGDEVLLTRSRFGRKEFVNFPGGGVEIGEAPIAALDREYSEETGLAIKPVRVLYALRQGGNDDDVLDLFWAPVGRIPTEEMFPSDHEFALKLPGLL